MENQFPDFEQFQRYHDQGMVVPVVRRILADTETPVSAYMKIARPGAPAFLLESVEGGRHVGRFSFLGSGPTRVLALDDLRTASGAAGADPFDPLRQLVQSRRVARVPGVPRFAGGAVGYVAYETVKAWEPVGTRHDPRVPLMTWMLFDRLIAFDNVSREMLLIGLAEPRSSAREDYALANERVEELERLLLRPVDPLPAAGQRRFQPESNMPRSHFLDMVKTARDAVHAGEAIQIVVSQRFSGEVSVGSFDIYRRLRVVNPSPYMFHLDLGDRQLVGASPEMLVRVDSGWVETRPIAGTRPRGRNASEDNALEQELLADEKERAEHLMLVDLGRNDIGRVSEFGTVEVPEFMTVERYSHVMHLVSAVRGRLRPELDALDALKACFPAGTVSGAPKVRAMQIIEELEPEPRGVYAGAVGYVDFAGNLDTCIAIRTIEIENGVASVQVGAGIVADSVPEREYEETLNKARGLIRTIELAEKAK